MKIINILHTKYDLLLHREFSQTPCHPEKTSGPKKENLLSYEHF